ncbi:hypothetical protein WJX73_007759 [Symbiochloris irregularis]|uniref:Uncharacterized protein n=1 Tax=Symbiochloris irregularis TaxID=706552 RepID=A0AAW1P760_9CHLO
MPLQVVSPISQGLVYLTFNQDSTCIAIADARGIKIYSLDSRKIVYSCELGAISLAEMLFSTSLMAYVGSGEQPLLTPRKLALMNTATQSSIQETSYTATILAVRLNRKRLVAVVDKFMYVHALETMELLRTIDIAQNLQGLCALTSAADPNLLAVPAAPDSGVIRVFDLLKEGGNVLCELKAHKSSLAALAWNHNSTMLASASCKGTVVRVHCLPQASKAFTFRRGTTPAMIHSLAFSGPGIEPALLCACSAHGTVHIFSLETADRHPAAVAASGLLAAVMPSSVGDLMEPARCIATVRLPCQGIPCMCTFAPCPPTTASTSMNGSLSSDGEDWGRPRVRLVAVTGAGMLHMYQVQNLWGPGKISCHMEGETDLLQER